MTNNLKKKAEALVKENIKGTRKGLPNELNYQHSFRVRELVSLYNQGKDFDEDLLLAALLHDIVEDGGISLDELRQMDFSDRTIELVGLCTHPMDVKDSTERWILMLAQLVKANNPDAWLIKLADLTDNLTQSKGLSPENRRFMIETKAPALLRLTQSSNAQAHIGLKNEMKKQRIE